MPQGNYASYGDLPSEDPLKNPKDIFSIVKKIDGVNDLNYLFNNFEVCIVMVSATWCGPCKQLAPMFEQLAKNSKQVLEIVFVYEDIDSETCAHKEICTNVPTFYIYHKGKLVKSIVSYFPILVDTVNNLLGILSKRPDSGKSLGAPIKRY